ncbi:MAG: caspase family protein [Hyphomicrobiales bacterium]
MLANACRFLFSAVLLAMLSLPALAEKRVALVIGNSAYKNASELKNPKHDAEALTALLKTVGFDVVKGTDLSYEGMRSALREFVYKLENADVAMLFYAGHGLQVNGRNYLVPVNADLKRELDLEFEAMRLDTILQHMETGAKTNLVFLDACRDNPLARNLARDMGARSNAIGKGLARVESGIGTLVAFATQPGNVAYDGEGDNSPFTTGLLKHIPTPGLDVALVMRLVRQDVIDQTGGTQVPWDNSSLTKPFVCKTSVAEKPAAAKVPDPQPNILVPKADPTAIELAFWQSASKQGTVEAFKVYLQRFPEGAFAPLAELQIKSLEKDKGGDAVKTSDDADKKVANLGNTRVVSVEPAATPPASEPVAADPRALATALQEELKRVGCDPGAIDGVWGPQATGALKEFGEHAKIQLSALEPTQVIIDMVKGKTDRVCPLTCSALQVLEGDKCVPKTCGAGLTLTGTGACIKVQPRPAPRVQAPRPPAAPRAAPSRPSGGSSCIIRGTGGSAGDGFSCGTQ